MLAITVQLIKIDLGCHLGHAHGPQLRGGRREKKFYGKGYKSASFPGAVHPTWPILYLGSLREIWKDIPR